MHALAHKLVEWLYDIKNEYGDGEKAKAILKQESQMDTTLLVEGPLTLVELLVREISNESVLELKLELALLLKKVLDCVDFIKAEIMGENIG